VRVERTIGTLSTAALLILAATFLPLLFSAKLQGLSIWIGATFKLGFLLLAALFATLSCSSFEKSNPVRRAWLLMAAGLWMYWMAQSVLAFYQLALDARAPFPSIADAFFVPATVLLVSSLFSFVRVYKQVGFQIARRGDVSVVVAFAAVLLAAFLVVVGRPVLASDAPVTERLLNVAYPVLDCFLFVPVVLLLRMAMGMRGGSLWKVWTALLAGFLLLAAGDILFAFFTTLGKTGLEPLLDLAFALSYVLIAKAAVTQYGILTAR
jgi:hypothetical protein